MFGQKKRASVEVGPLAKNHVGSMSMKYAGRSTLVFISSLLSVGPDDHILAILVF